jgi:hypothetical protein
MIAPKKKETRRERFYGLLSRNPAARIPDKLDDAYVGFTVGKDPSVAVYDFDHAVRILVADPESEASQEDLLDFFETSSVLAFECEDAPIFVRFDQ